MTSPGDTPSWRSRVRRARPILDVIPAIALVLVAIWEIVSVARAGSDVGSDADWVEASNALRQEWRVGDLIVFAPRWNDPVGRLHLGELLTLDDVGRMDADRYQVVWEVSIRGARAKATNGRTLASERRFGPLTLRRWVGAPVHVLTDFRAEFRPEIASGATAKRARLGLEEVGFEPHRCIVVVPRPDATVSIRFEGVVLGTEIVGYVGLADVFTRRDVRAPGSLRLVVEGREVANVLVGVDDGWVRFSGATTPAGAATVVFELTAVGKDAKDRHICFAAEARS